MGDEACTAASSLTVRVTIEMRSGRWPCNGNPKCKRGSSGLMADFISRRYRGLSIYGVVYLTRSVRMSDDACTAASSLTVRVTIEMRGGRWPCNGNPMRQF